MPKFTVYYWVQRGDKGVCVGETTEADNLDAATRYAQERLLKPSFFFDSVDHGRVIVVSANVQYVEIEEGGAKTHHLNDFPA